MSEKLQEFENEEHQKLINLLRDKLKKQGILKELPDLNIHYIGNNILCTEREGNIKVYYKYENGQFEVIFNLKTIRKDSNFEVSQVEAGYREIQSNGEYELYKINDIKEVNGKIIPNIKNKIDKYSLEYFNAWNHMCFSTDRISIVQLRDTIDTFNLVKDGKKYTNEQGYYYIDPPLIGVFIDSKSIRIRDLVSFKEHGQISKEVFDKYLPQVRELLLKQIGDKRFDRVNDGVSKTELDGYLKGGYISKELYVEAIKLMVELGKLDKKILDELKKEIKPKLSELEEKIKLG